MPWSHDEIAGIAFETLCEHEHLLNLEHAVAGLDALNEIEFHPMLAHGFAGAGFGVWREWPYPGDVQRRARRTARERCDLVLTPTPDEEPRDPVAQLREQDSGAGTLFAAHPAPEPPGVPPEEAYWLEIKCVGQHTYTDGVPGPNAGYASELTGGLATDLRKLSRESRIVHGGLLLILFGEDESTGMHDVAQALLRCLDKGTDLRSPIRHTTPICDRIGNQVLSVALIPRG
ncbi:MAG: hypothetical protein HUU18_11340 [Phycisphaerales bacterium]|nr:hypothetical protein [Phycisphaerales bacterium]